MEKKQSFLSTKETISLVLSKMSGGMEKKRHVSQKKLVRQCHRLEYEQQNGCQHRYKSGKRHKTPLTRAQEDTIIMALTIVKDYWFESYTPVQCQHIAKDFREEDTDRFNHIRKTIIKSSWAQYYYAMGVPLILRYRELQEIFDQSSQSKLKDFMMINEMKGVCEAIRIMYKEKCIARQIIRY